MVSPDWLQIAAASAVGAGAVSSVLNWIFNKDIKTIEYKNAILKEIFTERIKAFKEIREALAPFKGNRLIKIDGEPHLAFDLAFSPQDFNEALFKLQSIKEHNVWLSPKTNEELLKFRRLLNAVADDVNSSSGKDAVAVVGAAYQEMTLVQFEIVSHLVEKDFLSPFNMKKVLRSHKKKDPSILFKDSAYNFTEIKKQIDKKVERGNDNNRSQQNDKKITGDTQAKAD